MLTPLLFALAAPAAPAPTPAAHDAPSAANGMIDLTAGPQGQYCLPDGSCLSVRPAPAAGDAPLRLVIHYPAAQRRADAVLDLPVTAEGDATVALWPHAIMLPSDTARGETRRAIGVIVTTNSMYSGGGGSGGRLHLLAFATGRGGQPRLDGELLASGWDSSLSIRACFSEQEARKRRGACHDEYEFNATLAPAPQPGDAVPSLRITTVATAFPRTARRNRDSSDAPPLTRADLTQWRDPDCSYTRLLRYNHGTRRYEMDRPAPDCSAYTTP